MLLAELVLDNYQLVAIPDDHAVGDVLRDDCTGSDDTVFTNNDVRLDIDSGRKPRAVTNRDCPRCLDAWSECTVAAENIVVLKGSLGRDVVIVADDCVGTDVAQGVDDVALAHQDILSNHDRRMDQVAERDAQFR